MTKIIKMEPRWTPRVARFRICIPSGGLLFEVHVSVINPLSEKAIPICFQIHFCLFQMGTVCFEKHIHTDCR